MLRRGRSEVILFILRYLGYLLFKSTAKFFGADPSRWAGFCGRLTNARGLLKANGRLLPRVYRAEKSDRKPL
jgi:hypothetical protein